MSVRQADKTERRIRLAVGWAFYAVAAALGLAVCLWRGIDPPIGAVLFLLGYTAGRITKGINP